MSTRTETAGALSTRFAPPRATPHPAPSSLSHHTARLSPNARPTQPGKNGDANLDGSLVKCVYKVLNAKGKWSALGPDVGGVGGSLYGSNFPYDFVDSYKYGISFQVEVTGQLGKFDY